MKRHTKTHNRRTSTLQMSTTKRNRLRKSHSRRNKGFLSICLSIALLGAGLFMVTKEPVSHAARSEAYVYTSISIQKGDTLWALAEEYGQDTGISTSEYIKELKEINNLTQEKLTEGNHLIVFRSEGK